MTLTAESSTSQPEEEPTFSFRQGLRAESRETLSKPTGLDVKEVMKELNCFVVHAIETATEGELLHGTISALGADVSAADRIRFALARNPAISASSVVEGSKQIGYRKLALLVNGGTIMDASSRDMATEAVSVTQRKRRSHIYSGKEHVATDDSIKGVIEGGAASSGNNELIVNDPEFAGLVIVLREGESLREQVAAREAIKELLEEEDIPTFLLRGGKLQELSLTANGMGFVLKDEEHPTTSPSEAISLPAHPLSLESE